MHQLCEPCTILSGAGLPVVCVPRYPGLSSPQISMVSVVAGSAAGLGEPSGQLTDEEVPDIYDRQDMGSLRRRIRKAGETFLRERELYLSLVHQFLEVGACGASHVGINA